MPARRLTTEEFIARSRVKHGDRYDYSKSEYIGSHDDIVIICKVHGEFTQRASDHMSGFGCSICAKLNRIKTRDESDQDIHQLFIRRANIVHGDRYGYTLVIFNGSLNESVTIVCPIHGAFVQRARSHLKGHGCPKCAGCAPKTIQEFIQSANYIHLNRYDYSNSVYVGSNKNITIRCPIHGEFTQRAAGHLNGRGCPRCNKHAPLETKSFIQKAIGVHGIHYDYSQVNYTKSTNAVTIICRKHGPFEQMAAVHLSGSGCPLCNRKQMKTTEEFIANAINIHGPRYDYSEVNYTGANKKIIIICPSHGKFMQRANSHLEGHGCKTCSRESRD